MYPHENGTSDPAAIEAELARERQTLATTIDSLRSRLTVDALVTDAIAMAKSNAAPYTRALDTAVRANPLAAAMTGAGLAWLIFGRKTARSAPPDALSGTKFEALSRWEDEGGPPAPLPEADNSWIAETDALRDRAKAALARLDTATRAQLRPAADLARERAALVAQVAADIRRAMARGLDTLSAQARDRILAAREAAYLARVSMLRKSGAMIEDHPLLTGVAALAAGAALAAALPVTRTENRVLGPERDRLLGHAQRLLDAERARAGQVASSLADIVTADVQDAATRLARGAA